MNVTKLAGWLLLLIALIGFIITFADFGPDYAAAGEIGDKAEQYGLQTTATNLRFQIGFSIVLNILICGVLAIAGWWLTTSEVQQIIWIVLIGLFAAFSVVVRVSPVMPLHLQKFSPAGVFYGAQVEAGIRADVSNQYVVITRKKTVRTAQSATPEGQAGPLVVLDFSKQAAARQYAGSTLPLTVTGRVKGKSSIAKGNELEILPVIVVDSVKSGLPQKK